MKGSIVSLFYCCFANFAFVRSIAVVVALMRSGYLLCVCEMICNMCVRFEVIQYRTGYNYVMKQMTIKTMKSINHICRPKQNRVTNVGGNVKHTINAQKIGEEEKCLTRALENRLHHDASNASNAGHGRSNEVNDLPSFSFWDELSCQ